MFQEKDIVHIIGTDMYGIVDEISKHNKPIEISDYSDFQIPVKLIFKGQTYLSISMHDHYHPTELEYARLEENDTRRGFMEYMVKTICLSSWFSGTIKTQICLCWKTKNY